MPILGGAAARGGDQAVGEVLPKGEHGAVLLITEGKFDTGCKCIHETDVKKVHCEIRESRIIETIDGEPASPFLLKQRAAMGKPADDFESLTFREACGKNVRCAERGDGTIYAGANLTETDIMLSSVDRADADDAISAYMHRPNALSIGCAGLKSLLTKPFACAENNLGLFLFGEVVPYPDGRSRFANLTLGHLTAE
ncbi:MAG: hypothetical protein MJ099_05330 [Clostridia bacterium]|nr:hypothetical protein [Clostridia bacterium]